MILDFVKRFDANRENLLRQFTENPPDSYKDIVEAVVRVLHDEDGYGTPDPRRIVEIDHGDYQGTLVYVIGADGYQPHDYWYVRVWYGSCSGCDTFQAIRYSGREPETVAKDCLGLALNIVQQMRAMGDAESK